MLFCYSNTRRTGEQREILNENKEFLSLVLLLRHFIDFWVGFFVVLIVVALPAVHRVVHKVQFSDHHNAFLDRCIDNVPFCKK